MRASFRLAWRALVRGHVLTLLLAATAAAHALLPLLVRGDGTAAGGREMFVRAVTGGVCALTTVAVLACACGLLAREREAHRLALAVVRPAPGFAVVLGRWLALVAVAAVVLAFNAALTGLRLRDAPPCRHHIAPQMPPPAAVARDMLEAYLRDPATPEAVRAAPRRTVLALLAGKELDRYDVIAPGHSVQWPFPVRAREAAQGKGTAPALAVRVRFATTYSLRAPVRGRLDFGGLSAVVSNDTQAILDIPLARAASAPDAPAPAPDATLPLVFANTGANSILLRPRRDLEVLIPADAFAGNLARATFQAFTAVALLAAFGLFLSAALSRPVAVFTALVLLFVALMAPGVVEQFPDELTTSFANRLGLALSRGVGWATSALAAPSPIADLATDTCVEYRALAHSALVNLLLLPALFLALAALVIRRKPID